jgi:predicted enzyme related to lactoylglutathione lyase
VETHPLGAIYRVGMARPVHFEIHADDPQRAIAFYTGVFGWTVNQWADQQYWLVSTGPTEEPGIDGAILPRMGERPAVGAPVVGMVNTVQVDDLDASLAMAIELGGALALDKMVIPGVGTVAYVLDSEANVVGILQPEA